MKINTINTKFIKPCIPTPQKLNNYKLSFLDKQIGPVKFAVILYYESKPEDYRHLEESLAKILVQFYPLAGRYMKNDHLVDCSDQGVEFVEAEALDVELIDLVAKTTDIHQLNPLLPDDYFGGDDTQLMSIKATHFPRGGLTISVSVSHNLFDASSLGTFISSWSNATNPNNKSIESIIPSFDLASLLSFEDHDFGFNIDDLNIKDEELVGKRLVFDNEALTYLRSKVSSYNNGKMISRVRMVCAVIAKALIGLDRAKKGRSSGFLISQVVNMRERTIPPQPRHACGNLAIMSLTSVAASEAMDLEIQDLADLIGDAAQKTISHHANMLSPSGDGRGVIISTFDKFIKQLSNPETNVMTFSDWSKFGFYEADFGWGKPVWTSTGRLHRGFTVLMSNKEGDGIEAWLPLNKSDLRYLELDEDIKLFIP